MIVPALPPSALPPEAPATLEAMYAAASVWPIRLRKTATPEATLASPDASVEDKVAAADALQRSMTSAPQARRLRALELLRRSSVSTAEAPAVRQAALLHLGYAVPLVSDEAAREAAVRALLGALPSAADRLSALRGLTAAVHALPPAVETDFETALLDLLATPLAEPERIAALLALDGLFRSDAELGRRRPDLSVTVELRLLSPLAADPAAFAASGTPATRALVVATVWHAARKLAAAGDQAALDRVNAALTALAAVETDAAVRAEISSYVAAPPPDPLKPGKTSETGEV